MGAMGGGGGVRAERALRCEMAQYDLNCVAIRRQFFLNNDRSLSM